MNSKYKNLLTPFTFPKSGIQVSNRVVMAPMTTYSGNEDGTVSEAEIDYYRHRNQSAGLLITACAYVTPGGKAFPGQISAHTDDMIQSLNRIANTLKENGAKAILQIHHGGRMSAAEVLTDGQCMSASAVASERVGSKVPRAMTEKEIEECILAYGEATRRAILAGFDGVEIHGANTYLIQQFFSPHSNRRTDKWGGDLKRRMTFPLAVTDAVIQAVSKHANNAFMVGYRISPEEVENPGITIDDTLELLQILAQKKLDYLHVSTMDYWSGSMRDAKDQEARTSIILKSLGHLIPIIGVGGISTPDQANKVLDSGVSLVALGRILLMEPDWLAKAESGRMNEIVTTLALDRQDELVIPNPMWKLITTRPGWLPIK